MAGCRFPLKVVRRSQRTIFKAALGVACSVAGGAVVPCAATEVVIRNVHVVTMSDAGTMHNRAVVVEGGVVEAILPDTEADRYEDATVIDGDGGYLTPGLIDAHMHHREQVDYGNYIAHGVTTVLGLGQGDSLAGMLAVKEKIDSGEIVGPQIYTTGATIANHIDFEDPGEARAFVRDLKSQGLPYVKVYNNIPQGVFDAVVDEAARQGMSVFGHIPRTFPAEYSLANGLDVVAHAEEFYFAYFGGPRDQDLDSFDGSQTPDLAKAKRVLDLMVEHDVALIPNLIFTFDQMRLYEDEDAVLADPETTYLHPALRAGWLEYHSAERPNTRKRMLRERIKYNLIHEFTRRARDADVLIVAGTDTPLPGLYPGLALHREMRELVKAGLTYEEALAAATRSGGELVVRYVDTQARIGAIAPGYEADLVLLADNPLEDIRNTTRIQGVMTDGVWLNRDELDRMRAEIAERMTTEKLVGRRPGREPGCSSTPYPLLPRTSSPPSSRTRPSPWP